jgi:hypothetical protein
MGFWRIAKGVLTLGRSFDLEDAQSDLKKLLTKYEEIRYGITAKSERMSEAIARLRREDTPRQLLGTSGAHTFGKAANGPTPLTRATLAGDAVHALVSEKRGFRETAVEAASADGHLRNRRSGIGNPWRHRVSGESGSADVAKLLGRSSSTPVLIRSVV